MRKSYDFSKAKRNPYAKRLKRQITIRLDEPTIEYFKKLAEEVGIPYQDVDKSLSARLCTEQSKAVDAVEDIGMRRPPATGCSESGDAGTFDGVVMWESRLKVTNAEVSLLVCGGVLSGAGLVGLVFHLSLFPDRAGLLTWTLLAAAGGLQVAGIIVNARRRNQGKSS